MEEKELIDKIRSVIDPFINELHKLSENRNTEVKKELDSQLEKFENNLIMICTKKPLEIPVKLLDILANGGHVESVDTTLHTGDYLRGQCMLGDQAIGNTFNQLQNQLFEKGKYRLTLIIEKIE